MLILKVWYIWFFNVLVNFLRQIQIVMVFLNGIVRIVYKIPKIIFKLALCIISEVKQKLVNKPI